MMSANVKAAVAIVLAAGSGDVVDVFFDGESAGFRCVVVAAGSMVMTNRLKVGKDEVERERRAERKRKNRE